MPPPPLTLAQKVWDRHVVHAAPGQPDLLYIDLHLVHEVTSPQAFEGLRLAGRQVRRPDLTLATEDHNTPTLDIDRPIADTTSRTQIETLRNNAAEFGVRIHSLGDADQGIVHQVGPQLGLTQPGLTVVCGDSHTSTHGAFGALAFGIGTSEVEHVLATQTLIQKPAKNMLVKIEGALPNGVGAKDLILAKEQGRIGRVAADPLMTVRIFCDIGGTGARADAFTMWAAKFIGKEIRVLNHYEAVGQPAATHVGWLRTQGYTPDKAQIWLPHDGDTQDKVNDVSYASFLREAGYTVTVIPNQGKGAAKMRIEAARRLFPSIWFNESTTEGGRDALGWYHEKRDEQRGIGLGPEHDWASHSSDAFGLMCVAYEEPQETRPLNYPRLSYA